MKTLKKPYLKSPIILLATLILVGAVAATAYYFLGKEGRLAIGGETTQSTPKTESSNGTGSSDNQKKNVQPAYEDSDGLGELSGVISYKSVVNNILVIRTTINQVLNSGSCVLTLRSYTGKVVTQSADIAHNPSSSSCQGFDIPLSNLEKGAWSIEIKVTGDGNSIILKETVEI